MSAFIAVLAIFLTFPKFVSAAIEFNISNLQQKPDYHKVDVSLFGLTSSSCLNDTCYLQAILTAADKKQYFGFTWNGQDNWYEYTSSPDPLLILSTFFSFTPDVEGSWSGNLLVKNNPSHSGYKGEGDYLVKVRRYSGKSKSHSGESDSLDIHLTDTTPTEEPTLTPTENPTEEPTEEPTSTPTPTENPPNTPTNAPTELPIPSHSTSEVDISTPTPILAAKVLSAATESSLYKVFFQDSTVSSSPSTQSASTQSEAGVNLPLMGLGLVVLSGSALFLRNKA